MGTGKRQFVNYVTEFLNKDVIKLEYYCKNATVCDDILLAFSDIIDNLSISKAINLNAKITTLNVKFQQQISSIKKPFLIILHSLDDILPENKALVSECFAKLLKELNIDKKKYFVVKIKINPTDYKFEDYLLYVDYSKGYDIKFISLNNRSVNEN